MDGREAALRFWAGDRLQAAWMKKLDGVDRPTLAALVAFLGEPKLAPRVIRLAPDSLAKAFFDLALEPAPPLPDDISLRANPTLWARRQRHEVARATLRVLFEAAERKTKRAFDLLRALF